MSDKTLPGIAVWHELVTRDPEPAKAFYTALFGWGAQSWPMGEGAEYFMFTVGERAVCGIDTEHCPEGAPPFWMTYFSVKDVDAAIAANGAAGGKTLQAGVDIPEVGRIAVLLDPQGAVWCPFRSLKDDVMPDFAALQPGDFTWEELLTPDSEAAATLYAEMLGYEVQLVDMAELGPYRLLKVQGKGLAGIMTMPPALEAPPGWLTYVFMPDVDATAAKARELGGSIHVEPTDLPGTGRFAVLADPQGAVFAVFRPA